MISILFKVFQVIQLGILIAAVAAVSKETLGEIKKDSSREEEKED